MPRTALFRRGCLWAAVASLWTTGCLCEKRENRRELPPLAGSAKPGGATDSGAGKTSRAKPQGPVVFHERLRFTPWADAVDTAQSQKKPILVVIYSDANALSHKLASDLSDPEILALSESFVLVKADQNDLPPDLASLSGFTGQLLPRLLFLDDRGLFERKLRSTTPTNSYYYQDLSELRRNMRAALERVRGHR